MARPSLYVRILRTIRHKYTRKRRPLKTRRKESKTRDKGCATSRRVEEQESVTGVHECQVLGFGPETAESEGAWKLCKKHAGHPQFLAATSFGLDDLPIGFRNQQALDVVKTVAKLTVRVRVNYTSPRRPEWGVQAAAAGFNFRTGTGTVDSVEPGSGPCPCDDCCGVEPEARPTWHWLYILTAAHVVFCDEEVKYTWVDLFYDDAESKVDGRLKLLRAVKLDTVCGQRDLCVFKCVTHDTPMANELFSLRRSLPANPPDTARLWAKWDDGVAVVIVSHPHAQAKKITVGHELEMYRYYLDYLWDNNQLTRALYDTPTCPGSSGAMVIHLLPGGQPYVAGRLVHCQALDTTYGNASSLTRNFDLQCCGEAKEDELLEMKAVVALVPPRYEASLLGCLMLDYNNGAANIA